MSEDPPEMKCKRLKDSACATFFFLCTCVFSLRHVQFLTRRSNNANLVSVATAAILVESVTRNCTEGQYVYTFVGNKGFAQHKHIIGIAINKCCALENLYLDLKEILKLSGRRRTNK